MMKWIVPLLPVAAFPYTLWMVGTIEELTHISPVLSMALFWLAGLAGAIVVCRQALRGQWDGHKLALAVMIVKLVHIQNYGMLFLGAVGLGLLFPAIAVLIWIVDVMTISLTGLIGLAAVLRCRADKRLTSKAALVNGILQFVFCADVFSAIWVYRDSKEVFS